MPALTIKNVPDDLLRLLRERAERENRSLNKEVIFLLETAVSSEEESSSNRKRRQVEAWRRLKGRWESDVTTEEETRAILESRTSGRDVDL